ncbi:MAG: EamA family transporter [Bryobacteraceae bacterium]
MHSEHKLRVKTLILVLALVVCANVGDLTLKRGMTEIGAVELSAAGIARAFPLTLTNPKIWIGIFFLVGFMASYTTVLSWADYSYVMPVGAFGYAMLTFFAVVFLHEEVSVQRWVGVALVCIGVFLVGRTKPSTTETAQAGHIAKRNEPAP